MGSSLTPFIVNLWGGLGPSAEKMCSQLLKMILGHSEGRTRALRANEFRQRLSLSLVSAVGRQLRALGCASEAPDASLLELTNTPLTHEPYSLPTPGVGEHPSI